MFHNFVQLISGHLPPDDEHRFVEEVRVVLPSARRSPRVERVLLWCWLAIAAKCALVVWLVGRYEMSFSPLWVNGPTVFFALMCTVLYYWRE